MRRRDFVMLVAGAMGGRPSAVRAQQKAMPVIGLLGSTSRGAPFVAAFLQGLAETGYVEGQNAAIEYRWAEGRYDLLPALAAELVKRRVDVIVTQGGFPPTRAAKSATSSIPIVFAVGTDPVEDGLVASLARPGGNLTGVTFIMTELNPKRLELLSELVPQARLIALLVNQNNPTAGEGGAAPHLEGRHRKRDRRRLRHLRPAARQRASGRQRLVLLQPARAARRASFTQCRSGDL
jgi:putative ABC transport system substrate-binding protein